MRKVLIDCEKEMYIGSAREIQRVFKAFLRTGVASTVFEDNTNFSFERRYGLIVDYKNLFADLPCMSVVNASTALKLIEENCAIF